jgi:hypothetical protein
MFIIQHIKEWFQTRRDKKAKTLPEGYVDIVLLYKQGLIAAKGTGQSITDIQASVTSRVTIPIKVRIPHGTYFVSSGNHQNMVTRREYELELPPKQTRQISVPAACINANLPVPKDSDKFSGVARVSDNLARFLQAAEGEDAMTIQAGVWAITDRYSRSMIQSHLRVRRFSTRMGSMGRMGIPSSFGSSSDDGPAVSERQIDRAKGILDKLGIRHRL